MYWPKSPRNLVRKPCFSTKYPLSNWTRSRSVKTLEAIMAWYRSRLRRWSGSATQDGPCVSAIDRVGAIVDMRVSPSRFHQCGRDDAVAEVADRAGETGMRPRQATAGEKLR